MEQKGWMRYLELIPIFLIAVILFKMIDNSSLFSEGIGFFIAMFSYFIWAFAIAYLLNPLMLFIEKRAPSRRWVTLIIVYTLFIGSIILMGRIITPSLIGNISDLIDKIPEYYQTTEEWINETIAALKVSDRFGLIPYFEATFDGTTLRITETIKAILDSVLNGLLKGTNFLANFLFGLVISVYMLKDKEVFINSFKRLTYAYLNNADKAKSFFRFGREVNNIFSKFIIGKFLDSLIIGILCYVGLLILGIPYAIVLGLIVGITNMIPYFGPFIGMVPAFIITLFSGFWQAIIVLLFILVLQQFDGWYLGPKILGGSVGLSPFWIILAITIGGKVYGVMGMFLGVPVMAVIKKLLADYVKRRMESNSIEV